MRPSALWRGLRVTVNADLSLELWNGEVVPLGAEARTDIRLRIASPEAVRRLLFKPKLVTVFELYATGRQFMMASVVHL